MSSLKDFQAQHGSAWGELIGKPAFAAALALAHEEQIEKIRSLSDEEIAAKGAIILSDLRGHLKYEQALLGLHERKEFVFQQLGPEEYPDPEKEALDEAENINLSPPSSSITHFSGTRLQSAHEQLFPTPKPRRKKKLPPKRKPRKIRK